MSSTLEGLRQNQPGLSSAVLSALETAVVETFASICSAAPCPSPNQEPTGTQALALISLTGETPLSLMIAVPAETAVGLSESFAGSTFDFESDDMDDLVGEVANLVAGKAKTALLDIGIDTRLSLPTVVRGRDLRLNYPEPLETHRYVFTLPEGDFVYQVVTTDLDRVEMRMPGGDA